MTLRFLAFGLGVVAVAAAEPPRLVLQITVDQLRGDLLPRYRERFGAGGFRRLLDRGIFFANAHYETANTFTASGHAVLVTGADTAEHGMVANEWFDRESGQVEYCTADPRYPVLGEPAKPGGGMSPANLTSTTIGDELVLASGGRSRAFAVAGKDRSAIIPGGHLGRAFWFSEGTGGFVTSAYYGPELPAWLVAWNAGKRYNEFREREWQPLKEISSYRYAGLAKNDYARPNVTLGRIFPHPLVARSDAVFFTAFRFTPFLDEYTERFTEELMDRERIGRNGATDYLSISFSATDYIGHAWGPNSVEAEDNLLRLDATLARLLEYVDRTVGLEHTVIVLAADHGIDDIPEERRARGFGAARIYPGKLLAEANAALRRRLGVAEDVVQAFVPPGFYLDRKKLAALQLDPARVEAALADELRQVPGVAYACTRSDLLAGRVPRTAVGERIARGFHPTRSGDVVIVQAQFWYLYPDAETFAAMHGSPYSYDTFVPIVWVAPGETAQVVHAAVTPSQIAPTLAAFLGIKAPSGCSGNGLLPGGCEARSN